MMVAINNTQINESSFTKTSGGWIWPTGSSLFTPGLPPWESAPVGIPDVGQCPEEVNSVAHPSSPLLSEV